MSAPGSNLGGGLLPPVIARWVRTVWRVLQGGPEAPTSPVVIGGVAVGLLLAALVVYVLYRGFRRLRGWRGAADRAGTSTGDSGYDSGGTTVHNDVDLDAIDDETFDRAITILEQEGREKTRANIREQVARLLELQETDPSEFRLGLVRDAVEQARADQALIAPPSIEEEPTYLQRNGQWVRILVLANAPQSVVGGWLVPLLTTNLDVRVSAQLRPRDASSIRGALQQRLTQLQATLAKKEEKGRTDTHEEEADRQEIDRLLRRLTEGTTQLYDTAVYVEVAGSTREELDRATRQVQKTMADRGVELVPLEYRQTEAQSAIAPVATDPIRTTELLEHEAVSTLFPFVEPAVTDPDGVLYGYDETGQPVLVDRFSLSGYSKVITGKIGAGKTFAAKLTLFRRLLIQPDFEAIMFDPAGDDFVEFTRALDGQVITFGGDVTINPLDIHEGSGHVEDPYQDKLRSITGMLRTFFAQSGDSLSAEQAGLLQQVFHLTYLSYGITPDPATHDRANPTMADVLRILDHLADGDGPLEFLDYRGAAADLPRDERDQLDELVTEVAPRLRAGEGTAQHAKALLRALEPFQPEGVASNLRGETTVDLQDRLVCFDMSAFADTKQAPLLQHVMLEWTYQRARRQRYTPMEVVFEEVHYFLEQPEARSLVGLFTRHSRHFNAGLTLISQSPGDFLQEVDDEESDIHSPRKIYDQCDVKQLFYQKKVSDATKEYFDLSPGEVRFVEEAAQGEDSDHSECLLDVTGIGRRQLDVRASPFTIDVLTRSVETAKQALQAKIEYEAARQRTERGWSPSRSEEVPAGNDPSTSAVSDQPAPETPADESIEVDAKEETGLNRSPNTLFEAESDAGESLDVSESLSTSDSSSSDEQSTHMDAVEDDAVDPDTDPNSNPDPTLDSDTDDD